MVKIINWREDNDLDGCWHGEVNGASFFLYEPDYAGGLLSPGISPGVHEGLNWEAAKAKAEELLADWMEGAGVVPIARWLDTDRTHEECATCALIYYEPPMCNGHVAGPNHCINFKSNKP